MFVLIRAILYATVFISLVLIYIPAQLLLAAGVNAPEKLGVLQWSGIILAAAGAVIALWCVCTFVFAGKGTPAPFDPPRQLVTGGPYKYVRNPMYIGAGIALCGASLYFQSVSVPAYGIFLAVVVHLFVVFYEEPVLRRTFGEQFEAYCRDVRRWWPKVNV